MYDGFSDKGAHSTEWFEVERNFLMLAFASDHHEAKYPCNRCLSMRYVVTLLSMDLWPTT
jgi:hypothetical protein